MPSEYADAVEAAWPNAVWPSANILSRRDDEDGTTVLIIAYLLKPSDQLRRFHSLTTLTEHVPHDTFPAGGVAEINLLPHSY